MPLMLVLHHLWSTLTSIDLLLLYLTEQGQNLSQVHLGNVEIRISECVTCSIAYKVASRRLNLQKETNKSNL